MTMGRIRSLVIAILIVNVSLTASAAQPKTFHVLALYSKNVETDHVLFAEQALQFFTAMSVREGFECTPSDRWEDLNPSTLAHYQIVLWLNDSPHTQQQRDAFQNYMSHGGAWLGFHAAAYNDADTHWPWFVDFLGGAVFYGNSWPPLPATLQVDDRTHAVAHGLPSVFEAPANEWYIWRPDPRDNPNVKVLLTLDRSNFPLGLKDVLVEGDTPVVWTNTLYKMVYMNMGHGDQIFADPVQNRLIANAVRWLGRRRVAASTHP